MSAAVVHVKHASYEVYIGRAMPGYQQSKWANPFHIQDGYPAERVVEQYEAYLMLQPDLMAALPELQDKMLGCWCRDAKHPDAPCHGDVLARLAAAS